MHRHLLEDEAWYVLAPTPTRYLLVTSPRTAGLLTALHDGTARDRAAVADLFSRFGVELLD